MELREYSMTTRMPGRGCLSFPFQPPHIIHPPLTCLLNLFPLSRSLFLILLIIYLTFYIDLISDLTAMAAQKIKSNSSEPEPCGPGIVRKAYDFKGNHLGHFSPRTRWRKVENWGKIMDFSKSQDRIFQNHKPAISVKPRHQP